MKDLTGQRFGRLLADKFSHMHNHTAYWHCVCDCGKTKTICGTSLTRGYTKSCGCLHDEKCKERATKHGETHTKLYYVWQAMISRCQKKNNKSYKNYGGRGITVCADWQDYNNFAKWAKNNGYELGKSIDRIDNNGNYCSKNCRWATRQEQNNNKRRTIKIEYDGQTKTLTDWSKELGIRRDTLYARIYCYHWNINKAFNTTIGD